MGARPEPPLCLPILNRDIRYPSHDVFSFPLRDRSPDSSHLVIHRQIGILHPVPPLVLASVRPHCERNKKADVVEYPQGFDHIGLLVNEPSGPAGLPFV